LLLDYHYKQFNVQVTMHRDEFLQ